MTYKKSLEFYNQYIKSASDDKLFLCRSELLFRHHIVPSIEKKQVNLKKSRFSIVLYLSYLLLSLLSLFYIIKLKIFKKKTAHYLIDIKNSDEFYDFRSKEILEIINPGESVNFMHINNVKYSLKSWYKKTNTIYFEAIYYVMKPFLSKKRFVYQKTNDKFANEILELHQNYYNDSYHIYTIVKYMLKFLDVKQLVCLDDSRYINELNLSARELNIKSFAYMHGRFNEYHISLFEFPFDKYFVWNRYFKEKVLKISSKYKEENILVSGHIRIKKTFKTISRNKTILWLGESNIDYNELTPYIESILKNGTKLIYRGKPGENSILKDFLFKHNIQIDNTKTFFESLELNKIGLVIGTHSTALMEAWLLDIPSLALNSSYDYGSHLWEDELIEVCSNTKELEDKINYYLSSNETININISKVKNIIWGNSYKYDKNIIVKKLGQSI